MSEYMFPILSIDDLVASMPFITEADFKKPEPSRWYKIYGMIFESLTEEKAENGEEKALLLFPKYCKSENPDFFEDASCILWFTMVMQQLFYYCGISDFTFKDIRDPKPKRCIVLFSAIVNFLRFKANREPIIESVLEKVERYKLQYDKVEKTNNELKDRLAIEMAGYNQRETQTKQLQEEVKIISDNLASIQTESQNVLAKISEKKMLIAETRARRDELKCQIMKISQEREKLQRNIVQSPQKLKDIVSTLQERVEALKQTKTEKMEQMTNQRAKLEEMKTRHGIIEQGIRFMQSMVEDTQSKKCVEEEIKTITESRQTNMHKIKTSKRNCDELVESISLIQDRTQKLLLQSRTRAADLDACFLDVTEKKKKSTTKINSLIAEKRTLEREKEAALKNINFDKNKCTEKTDTILQHYKNILKDLNQYHFFLNENLAAISQKSPPPLS